MNSREKFLAAVDGKNEGRPPFVGYETGWKISP